MTRFGSFFSWWDSRTGDATKRYKKAMQVEVTFELTHFGRAWIYPPEIPRVTVAFVEGLGWDSLVKNWRKSWW